MAKTYRIHPAIGVARVGNSMETFIGPEVPGTDPGPADGTFKTNGHLKRQAQRFRIFEYDSAVPDAEPVEVSLATADVSKISWTVKLANRKAAGNLILNGSGQPRNPGIPAEELIIAPSAKTLNTPGQHELFDDGKFRGKMVPLGDARMEESGHLVVAGGFGKSDFVLKPGEQGGYTMGGGLSFANNRFWYDDTSDGPVEATIEFANGVTARASSAWLVVGPPDFAPGVGNVVTLYDLMLDLVTRQFSFNPSIYSNGLFNPQHKPSFTKDIYPILNRASQQGGVNLAANLGHLGAMLTQFDELSTVPVSGNDPHQLLRQRIFQKLRDPDNPSASGTMPRLNGDDAVNPVGLTLRPLHYFFMKQWSEGAFVGDWNGPPPAPTIVTGKGLDRAALEHCTGGSFYPGIEVNRIVAIRPDIYLTDNNNRADEIRLRPESQAEGRPAGFLTQDNALPWQADFLKCQTSWWPAQRPDQVFESSGGSQVEWIREKIVNHKDMVERWYELGVVVNQGGELIETERNPENMFFV